ncbi:prenyltransferase/squalene oxidase repeat-containing protein [Paenibacillus solisilvae]|uniref:Prenyltransferase/squalene oxidase repeat-containing protein n=1 Tax=Paenibacillus solisilvae TaxID=2486751 RepID=A0ABW0VRH9_9BACL
MNVQHGIDKLVYHFINTQSADGTWRFGFIEYGTTMDAAVIMLLQTLGYENHKLIDALCHRIQAKQHSDGGWRVYPDEHAPNLCATVESYFALLYAGVSASEASMVRARSIIMQLGGISRVNSLLTKFLLAVIGEYEWPRWFPVPLAFMMLPTSSPVHFFQFSGYARAHMAPMLILADRKPAFGSSPLSPEQSLLLSNPAHDRLEPGWERHFNPRILAAIKTWTQSVMKLPGQANTAATRHAEQYMLDRIEPDGTLYSFASATVLMIHALRAIGYAADHEVIKKAVQGLESMVMTDLDGNRITLQNTTSTVWDTSLISHALQSAGLNALNPSITQAGQYLLSKQHSKLGDWQLQVQNPVPGGWGFSHVNHINPDIDDTTAALRAIYGLRHLPSYREASNKGLQWLLAMQNSDGGWAAFERNNNHRFISWLPLDGADDAATDPSIADLTGRTLEYAGGMLGLKNNLLFIKRAVQWLYQHQEDNGSWYGRWGICYIYGTWAALTGLSAVGEPPDSAPIMKAKEWLLQIQNEDGGFGESCFSDKAKAFIPLTASTLSQTAWALDALISVSDSPCKHMNSAVQFLLEQQFTAEIASFYPTGAALPGHMYTRYDSYSLIWPLLALSNYRKKYLN